MGAESLATTLAADLRADILALRLMPGARIPVVEVCERAGVSRTTFAAALRRLEAEGLVEIAPQSGSRVARLSRPAIEEAAFLREALEAAAVARVAADPAPETLAALEASLARQARLAAAHDFDTLFAEDQAFHDVMLAATGFAGLPETVRRTALPILRVRLLAMPDPGRAAATVAEHRAIVAALAARDPAAASAAMAEHLHRMRAALDRVRAERPELFEVTP
ncbi:MAG: GntR family transcriptional regulator [Shimia sp.]